MSDELFDYSDMGEAWVHFTKCARGYFARLVKKRASTDDPDMPRKVQMLKYKDYCARLMYVMSFFSPTTHEVDESGGRLHSDFDLDWAMMLAKPSAVSTAKIALKQLIEIGMIEAIAELDVDEPKRLPPGPIVGGNTNPDTEFDFD